MCSSYSYLQNERQKAKGLFVAQLPNTGKIRPVSSGLAILAAREQCAVPYDPSRLALVAKASQFQILGDEGPAVEEMTYLERIQNASGSYSTSRYSLRCHVPCIPVPSRRDCVGGWAPAGRRQAADILADPLSRLQGGEDAGAPGEGCGNVGLLEPRSRSTM